MFTDALIMDKTWEVPGGFLAFSARFARTGIQMYDGSEIDPDGAHKMQDGAPRFKAGTLYPVDRPAEEVFAPRAMASFIAKPLTNDHPAEGVTIDDWNAKTKGVIGETLRDGEYARLSGLMTDKALIADYKSGKRELSGGYSANIVIGDGVNAAGQAYVAKQTQIDGNHVAFVDRGRAGSQCRVADAAPCAIAPKPYFDTIPTNIFDSLNREPEMTTKTITFDGLPLLVTDAAEAAISKLQGQIAALTTDKVAVEGKVAEHVTTIAARDAEIATLTQAVADAKVTPAQLRAAGKAFEALVADAKRVAPAIQITDAMDEPAIRKAAVIAKLGDKAVDGWTDAQFETSFVTNVALLGDAGTFRQTIPSGQPVNIGDRRTVADATRKAWLAAKENAHTGQAA